MYETKRIDSAIVFLYKEKCVTTSFLFSDMLMKLFARSTYIAGYMSSYSETLFEAGVNGRYVVLLKTCNEGSLGVSVLIRHNSANLSSKNFNKDECFTFSAMVQMSSNDHVSAEMTLTGYYNPGMTGSVKFDINIALVQV